MHTITIAAASAALIALGIATAVPAAAAQGGEDEDGQCSGCKSPMQHSWLKIGHDEIGNAMNACLQTGDGHFGCQFTVPLVEQEHSRNPNANGYWAERYYEVADPGKTVRVRSGAW